MKLLVVRHAQTKANEQKLINGQSDDLLSENGRKEIPVLVEKLRPYKFEAIYSSPLKRAMETAMPIADKHKVEIDIDRRIIEVNMGSFTQRPYDSTVEVFGKISRDLLSTYAYDLRDFGGESADEVKARIEDFLNDLRNSGLGSVLIVTHGGIIRWFYYLCAGKKVNAFPNLSIHPFEV